MGPYRRFKKKYRVLHLLLISTALVMSWWGVWGLLDLYFLPDHKALGYLLSILISFFVLYLDGFHLRDLQ